MKLGDELWKKITGYENKYEVSNHGRVRNLNNRNILKPKQRKNKIYMSLCNGKKDYTVINLNRLVADHFMENPENKERMINLDGDKMNNHVDNLQWMTRKEHGKWLVELREKYPDRDIKKENSKQYKKRKGIRAERKIHREPKKPRIREERPEGIWKDITGYEGLYQISDDGRIWSIKSNLLKKFYLCSGYYHVQLSKTNNDDDKQAGKRVHRLVAKHFVPNKKPHKYNVVDHIDNDKFNNHATNLRWTNSQGNRIYAEKHKTYDYKPILQYDLQGNLIKEWKSMNEITENTHYVRSPIHLCIHGKRMTAYKHVWRYKEYEEKEEIIIQEEEVFKNIGTIKKGDLKCNCPLKDKNRKLDLSDYDVSNFGRIRSKKTNIILKTHKSNGYHNVTMYAKSKKRAVENRMVFLVHRIVALLFVEGKTEEKKYVNHIDENKFNNRSDNLEWVTPIQNAKHSCGKRVEGTNIETGEKIEFDSIQDAGRYLGKKYGSSIIKCCKGKQSVAWGYTWRYI